jgi:hypothetical protein
MELDVGVPSSSELKILNRLDLRGVLTWIGVGSGVDLGPERTTIGVEARLVGVDALATFFLTVVWNFAEHANLLVPVGVAPGLRLIRVPPGVGVAPVAAGTSVVSPEVPVLTPGCLVGGFLWAIVDGVDSIFRIIVNGKNMRRSFGFLSGERLDGC